MTPQSQDRPISFTLHNKESGNINILELVVRPEDMTVSRPHRVSVHQAIGGAWADSFGPGLPSINISGTTGWRGGATEDGVQAFLSLQKVFADWHAQRGELLKAGASPDKVDLIFCDDVAEICWAVAPQVCVLKRSRSRPLLMQYQIALSYLSDDVAHPAESSKVSEESALSSLGAAIGKIKSFVSGISSAINTALGPLKAGAAMLASVTGSVLGAVHSVMSTVGSVTGGLLGIARDLTRAAHNVFSIATTIIGIPATIKAQFQQVAGAFMNAFCILKNAFRSRVSLPNFDDVYGASLCSSTSGGRPLSPYLLSNTFEPVLKAAPAAVAVSLAAGASLEAINRIDPIFPPPFPDLNERCIGACSGITLLQA